LRAKKEADDIAVPGQRATAKPVEEALLVAVAFISEKVDALIGLRAALLIGLFGDVVLRVLTLPTVLSGTSRETTREGRQPCGPKQPERHAARNRPLAFTRQRIKCNVIHWFLLE
jgi:hypothetical protein